MQDIDVVATFDSSFDLIEQKSENSVQSNSSGAAHPNDQVHESSSFNNGASTSGTQPPSGSKYARIVSIDEIDINKYIYYPGKIEYKKRKQTTPIPSVVSSSTYRASVMSKAKKSKGAEWICVYCKKEWSEEDKKGEKYDWIGCDTCDRKMHIHCIPISHMNEINFEWESNNDADEEVDFQCEVCLRSKS